MRVCTMTAENSTAAKTNPLHVLLLHSLIFHSAILISSLTLIALTWITLTITTYDCTAIIAQPPAQRQEWIDNRHTTTPSTAASASNFRQSIVISCLSEIIFNRKVLIRDRSRM
ncbi:hypothetical protein HanIR_Chr13g0666891 [Helianthus annuus]|nr:hypothetical protein HanIR_Chr13g0666891 [Helianthus annuus]